MKSSAVKVPVLGGAEAWWHVPPEAYASKRAKAAGTGSYTSAIPAVLEQSDIVLPAELTALNAEALLAAGRFDGAVAETLGAESGAQLPMASILLRTESSSSSTIENLTASAKQLALAELDDGAGGNARTVVGNVRAMEAAVALSGNVDVQAILEMHRALMEHHVGFRAEPGVLRDQLVWVGGSALSPRGAAYIAPQADLVPGAMAELVAFIRREDLDPLTQTAIAHAQFETIHPFTDGNGRTGRALVQALLRRLGVSRHMTLPVSAGLLRDTPTYFDALSEYRGGNAAPIISVFSEATIFAAGAGRALVADLGAELQRSREKLRGVRADATAHRLLPFFVGQPVLDVAHAAGLLHTTVQAAARAMATLADRGVVVELTGRLRGRAWQHPGILGVLDGFAEGIRRMP